jgi:DNA gyrase inhibitor GyrI
MRVASCRVTGTEPEIEAFKQITAWAQEAGVLGAKGTRFFGFDNPSPSDGNDEYGYEVWATSDLEVKAAKNVSLKDFPGGLYAVTRTRLPQIGQSWRDLVAWRDGSKYREGDHQCLEEHLVLPLGNYPEAVEIDLYLPIAE